MSEEIEKTTDNIKKKTKGIIDGFKETIKEAQKDFENFDLEKETISGIKEVESSLSVLSDKVSKKRGEIEDKGIKSTVKKDATVTKEMTVGATKDVLSGIGKVAKEIKNKTASGSKYVMPPIKKFVANFKNMPTIDELLIMTCDGLLIRHFTYSESCLGDEDLLSSMLTVVQDFVTDSFNEKKTDLKELRMGDFNILIHRGKYTGIVVLSSDENLKSLEKPLDSMIEEIEVQNETVFQDWNGDIDEFIGIEDCVNRLVQNEY